MIERVPIGLLIFLLLVVYNFSRCVLNSLVPVNTADFEYADVRTNAVKIDETMPHRYLNHAADDNWNPQNLSLHDPTAAELTELLGVKAAKCRNAGSNMETPCQYATACLLSIAKENSIRGNSVVLSDLVHRGSHMMAGFQLPEGFVFVEPQSNRAVAVKVDTYYPYLNNFYISNYVILP